MSQFLGKYRASRRHDLENETNAAFVPVAGVAAKKNRCPIHCANVLQHLRILFASWSPGRHLFVESQAAATPG